MCITSKVPYIVQGAILEQWWHTHLPHLRSEFESFFKIFIELFYILHYICIHVYTEHEIHKDNNKERYGQRHIH